MRHDTILVSSEEMLVACCAVGRNENLFSKFDSFSMAFAGLYVEFTRGI